MGAASFKKLNFGKIVWPGVSKGVWGPIGRRDAVGGRLERGNGLFGVQIAELRTPLTYAYLGG